MLEDKSLFDRLVDQAWPAPCRVRAGPWIHRYASGVTKRANSVLPLGAPADLGQAVAAAERFYAARGLPCVFSVGEGAAPGLDGHLEARGYRVVDPTLVLVRSLEASIGGGAAVRESQDGPPSGDAGEAALADRPSPEWLRAWWSVDGRPGDHAMAVAESILTGVPATYATFSAVPTDSAGSLADGPDCAGSDVLDGAGDGGLDAALDGAMNGWFRGVGDGGLDGRFGGVSGAASWEQPGAPARRTRSGRRMVDAVGRSVRQGEWLGIYCMAVRPPARRRGLAREVLRALLSHGREQGASHAYLVVVAANAAARALYQSEGFAARGRYHYRIR